MLFGLYALVKIFGKVVVNIALLVYFCFIGMAEIKPLLLRIPESWPLAKALRSRDTPAIVTGPIDLKVTKIDAISLTQLDLIALALSGVIALCYAFTQHWLVNNVIGVIFCVFTIQSVFLGDFKRGAILLGGLFFYDIFWVFGTDVMETVARSIDGPIKLLFPRKLPVLEKKDLALLGLGDIVIPGLFVSLCLRFDVLRQVKPSFANRSVEGLGKHVREEVSTPYFWFCMGGYLAGILATVSAMLLMERGQPALLYLVPGCLLSVVLCAFLRKEFTELTKFDEYEEMKKFEEEGVKENSKDQ